MTTLPKITDIRFIKVNRKKSLVGFVSFLYDGRMAVKDIAVHSILEPKDGLKYRLVYPNNTMLKVIIHPVNKETQQHIDRIVNDFLIDEERKSDT